MNIVVELVIENIVIEVFSFQFFFANNVVTSSLCWPHVHDQALITLRPLSNYYIILEIFWWIDKKEIYRCLWNANLAQHSQTTDFYKMSKDSFLSSCLPKWYPWINKHIKCHCGCPSPRLYWPLKIPPKGPSWGQFHQCVYAQLLLQQVPKAQKAAWSDCLICPFGICMRKSWA